MASELVPLAQFGLLGHLRPLRLELLKLLGRRAVCQWGRWDLCLWGCWGSGNLKQFKDTAGGHTASNAPDLFRPPKLTAQGPVSTGWGTAREDLRVLPAFTR